MRSRVSSIKKSQKESLYFRTISSLFLNTSLDDSRLQGLHVTKVELSPDKGTCKIFFGAPSEEDFNDKLELLTLYKPSLRKAIGQEVKPRRVPEIIFRYDKQLEKQHHIEDLMDQLKKDGKL